MEVLSWITDKLPLIGMRISQSIAPNLGTF
jgi:hypothetical protein